MPHRSGAAQRSTEVSMLDRPWRGTGRGGSGAWMGGRQSHHNGGGDGGHTGEEPVSYWQMMRLGYQELVNAIIRPPRAEYELVHLGPGKFEFLRRKFHRKDFEVVNERGQTLRCSHWEPEEYPELGRLPAVIYMHGNSSARVEALPQLSLCLSLGVTLVALDFAGSGMSQGDYVSLGYYERDDLKAVIEYLRRSGRVSYIALWGRSMGAATALMHAERDPSIAAMILDSSFADLQQLADEIVEKGREHGLSVPKFVTRLALRMIKSSVQSKAGFDIRHLSPVTYAPRCFAPALFIAGEADDFISPAHSRQIHDVYAGDRNLIIVPGDHNSMRPRFMYDSVAFFLQNALQLKEEWALEGGQKYVGLPPWLRIEDGRLYIDDDEALAEYWAEFLVDDSTSPPGPALERGLGAVSDNSAGHVEMNVGMTQARQREVQNAVYHMLGSQGTLPPQGGTSARRPSRTKEDESLDDDSIVWACLACTLENKGPVCALCGAGRPDPMAAPSHDDSVPPPPVLEDRSAREREREREHPTGRKRDAMHKPCAAAGSGAGARDGASNGSVESSNMDPSGGGTVYRSCNSKE